VVDRDDAGGGRRRPHIERGLSAVFETGMRSVVVGALRNVIVSRLRRLLETRCAANASRALPGYSGARRRTAPVPPVRARQAGVERRDGGGASGRRRAAAV